MIPTSTRKVADENKPVNPYHRAPLLHDDHTPKFISNRTTLVTPSTVKTTYREDSINLSDVENPTPNVCIRRLDPPEERKDDPIVRNTVVRNTTENSTSDICIRKIDPPETRKEDLIVTNTFESSTSDLCIRK
jgi:hypothetical protein